MPGEDQERFEDYLELETFITELQAGHVVHPPQELTPAQARIYRMAMLFHAATPGVSEPDPEFATQLQGHLEAELQTMQYEQKPTSPRLVAMRKPRVSRRMLLAGGAAVAASAVLGAGIEHMAENTLAANTSNSKQIVTVKADSPLQWFAVTTLATLGNEAVKFRVVTGDGSNLLTGYVVRSDGTNGNASQAGKVIALSAACTHKGCIVNWSGSDRKFHCPCHSGSFMQDGDVGVAHTSPLAEYLTPLPTLEVKVENNGQILVRMPENDKPKDPT